MPLTTLCIIVTNSSIFVLPSRITIATRHKDTLFKIVDVVIYYVQDHLLLLLLPCLGDIQDGHKLNSGGRRWITQTQEEVREGRVCLLKEMGEGCLALGIETSDMNMGCEVAQARVNGLNGAE